RPAGSRPWWCTGGGSPGCGRSPTGPWTCSCSPRAPRCRRRRWRRRSRTWRRATASRTRCRCGPSDAPPRFRSDTRWTDREDAGAKDTPSAVRAGLGTPARRPEPVLRRLPRSPPMPVPAVILTCPAAPPVARASPLTGCPSDAGRARTVPPCPRRHHRALGRGVFVQPGAVRPRAGTLLGRAEETARLVAPEPGVGAFGGEELVVAALFDDGAPVEDDEAVHAGDGAEAVGDDEGGAALHQAPQGVLDEELALRVERAGRLVEEQDRGVAQDGPGEGDALALAAGEFDAPLPHQGGETVGELVGELGDVGGGGRRVDLLVGGAGPGEGDVVVQAAVEHGRFLGDVGDQ